MQNNNVTLLLTDEVIDGFLDTVLENHSSIGYWDDVQPKAIDIRRGPRTKDLPSCPGYVKTFILRYNDPKTEELQEEIVDYDTIRKGVQKMMERTFQVSRTLRASVLANIADGSLGSCDVEEVDVILQAALFGEIVYG